ncbi:hypothetical protein SAMN00017477_1734 [Peptoniphilus asaccharolyticus DSM 20463]|uniref:Uncharacterized protein n=1 Tax=Peptoniphilus asaccharolyticus DSM 20463 TaxID=573058 RepID=A0A1W1VCD6_PEPAS|nr:hypothetical protein [Peptoniphilus asaccharolyticus]MBL7575612.1 hypothetical protein [Peptoniphilus asaccharolyticus]SMB90985.1 hypothetical protein SAMN00017477_1734 [Peptoniphilus asaccharolyticus DSM 20463]
MKEKFINFMRGRYAAIYGIDELNKFLLIIFIIQRLIYRFAYRFQGSEVLAVILVVIVYYRSLSKDLSARYQENRKFLDITSSIRKPFKRLKNNVSDRDYKYIECPSCKQELRVPKKKGKIVVKCKKCGTKFNTRT